MLAFEWGVAMALTWWPFMGTVVARLASDQNHVVSPPVLAFGILSPLFPIAAATFGSVLGGTQDPTQWLVIIGGPLFGTLAILVVSVANLDIMIIQFYVGAIAIQQVQLFRRLRWELVVAILVFPGIYCALRPHWALEIFTTALSYGGVIFVGIAAVTFVDYVILRRQHLDPAQLFNRSPFGKYYFWKGFNLVAIAVVAFSAWFDLWMYDPVAVSGREAFRYIGATLPTLFISGTMYYVLTQLISIPLEKGGYEVVDLESQIKRQGAEEVALTL
jgi:NCS1 family nucleobase:cation symporter-1